MKRSFSLVLIAMVLGLSLASSAQATGQHTGDQAAHSEGGKGGKGSKGVQAKRTAGNTPASGPTRQQVLDLVKTTCPDRIGELDRKSVV